MGLQVGGSPVNRGDLCELRTEKWLATSFSELIMKLIQLRG